MKNFLFNSSLFILSALCGWLSIYYFQGEITLAGLFVSGIIFGIFLMNLKMNVKDGKINSYKRELEKESVISTESSARVKVLESKIEVLERALENALNKN